MKVEDNHLDYRKGQENNKEIELCFLTVILKEKLLCLIQIERINFPLNTQSAKPARQRISSIALSLIVSA